ncbi:hypothetical protein PENTCL1PPCAC_21908, partial [Pristionchus entomophagus]
YHATARGVCKENQELTSGGVCPPRCQIAYKFCILPAFYGCYCKEGFLWNFEMTECIPQAECDVTRSNIDEFPTPYQWRDNY